MKQFMASPLKATWEFPLLNFARAFHTCSPGRDLGHCAICLASSDYQNILGGDAWKWFPKGSVPGSRNR